MKSLREQIEEILDEQFCISLRYQDFHSEGTIKNLKEQAVSKILGILEEGARK